MKRLYKPAEEEYLWHAGLVLFHPERWTPGPDLDQIRILLIERSHRFYGTPNLFKSSRTRAGLNRSTQSIFSYLHWQIQF